MSLKRTFGLVGDYGSSSESDTEEDKSETLEIKKTKQEVADDLKNVDDATTSDSKITPQSSATHKSEKAMPCDNVIENSKWEGVRREYEDSSLMFKYIQDTETEASAEGIPNNANDGKQNRIGGEIDVEKAASEALAAADAVLASQSMPVNKSLEDPVAKTTYYKKVYEESLKAEQAKKEIEEAALNWEIKEIQREIEEERKKWDAVWSDDEGEGAESEAVYKDQKRRASVLQAVIDEVKKTNKKPEEEDKKMYHSKKGEGWKRLQIIAESRAQNDPDKYGSTYPSHKFPLRD